MAETSPGILTAVGWSLTAESADGGATWIPLTDHRTSELGGFATSDALMTDGELLRALHGQRLFRSADGVHWERELGHLRFRELYQMGDRFFAVAVDGSGARSAWEAVGAGGFAEAEFPPGWLGVDVEGDKVYGENIAAGFGSHAVVLTATGVYLSSAPGSPWQSSIPFGSPVGFDTRDASLGFVGDRYFLWLDPDVFGAPGGIFQSPDGLQWQGLPLPHPDTDEVELFGGSDGDFQILVDGFGVPGTGVFRAVDPSSGWTAVAPDPSDGWNGLYLERGPFLIGADSAHRVSFDDGATWVDAGLAGWGVGSVGLGTAVFSRNASQGIYRRQLVDLWVAEVSVEGGGGDGDFTLCDPVRIGFKAGNSGFVPQAGGYEFVGTLLAEAGAVVERGWFSVVGSSALEVGATQTFEVEATLPADLPPGQYQVSVGVRTEIGMGAINTANDQAASPLFSLAAIPIEVSTTPGGDVSATLEGGSQLPSPAAFVAPGSLVSFSAHIDGAASFGGWTANGTAMGQQLTLDLVVISPSLVEASFVPYVEPRVAQVGEGTVEIDIPGGGPLVAADVAVTATAEPAPGWTFAGWLGQGGSLEAELSFLPDPGMVPPRAVFVPETSYGTWADGLGLSGPLRDPFADADGNGSANLWDYGKGPAGSRPFALEPWVGAGGAVAVRAWLDGGASDLELDLWGWDLLGEWLPSAVEPRLIGVDGERVLLEWPVLGTQEGRGMFQIRGEIAP